MAGAAAIGAAAMAGAAAKADIGELDGEAVLVDGDLLDVVSAPDLDPRLCD